MLPGGTATTIASAPEASPPSRPKAVTVCPARDQRRPSAVPILPRPIVAIRMPVVLHLHLFDCADNYTDVCKDS